jgi:23S rRNA (uracil1939-C5)-methyltransferase
MARTKKKIVENVLVEKYVAEGKCLGYINEKVVFIEKVIPGDVVDVLVFKNKKDYAEAYPTAFKTYSPLREKAFCSHFGSCGGCVWQMLPYPQQLDYKQQQVIDQLTRIGRINLPTVNNILGSASQSQYRNKLEYTYSTKRFLTAEELNNPEVSANDEVAGFHAKGLYDKIIDVDICHLQPEPTNAIRKFIKQFCINNKLPFYDIKNHTGWIRTVQVRTSSLNQVMVNIMIGYMNDAIHELATQITAAIPSITCLLYTVNGKANDSLHGLTPITKKGNGFIMEKLGDYEFKISPKSFFQTNTAQATVLYEATKLMAKLDGSQVVYDLYCGTGSIGIYCSAGAKKIIGVELIEEAIQDAKENAAINKVENALFFAGAAEKICTEHFFAEHGRPDVVITDPPRAGMHKDLVEMLLRIRAPRIVYVSCNPATQARDLQVLCPQYKIEAVQPVDLFPHTHHIENIVSLVLA